MLEQLAQRDITGVWSENDRWTTPAALTTPHAYLRFIGDRELDSFGELQRDPEPAIDRRLERLRERHDELDSARVYANNHFAGFGPGTANATPAPRRAPAARVAQPVPRAGHAGRLRGRMSERTAP